MTEHTIPELAGIQAFDESRESSTLAKCILGFIPAHSHADFIELLNQCLSNVPDIRRALIGLNRFLEVNTSAELIAKKFVVESDTLKMLLTLFSQSVFMTDILCKSPDLLDWIAGKQHRLKALSVDTYLDDLNKSVQPDTSIETACRVMRLYRRKAMLRIGVRVLVDHAPLDSVTEDLSNLADAMLVTALHCVHHSLIKRYGTPMFVDPANKMQESTFVIIALGKLGGYELNFSSDIDLLFIYSEEGETQGTNESIDNATWFRKLGELLIKVISENTADGHIFRVDMRLRPHGRVGPLAVSLHSAVEYYADYGRAWERQALIKARPCAGDLELGQKFMTRMRPFVFPRFFDDTTLQDIRETKQQTESMISRRGSTELEVKLGRGGIRDIEFTVQMLQLLNGGHQASLRTTNTLQAIDALGRAAYLSPLEATTLADHYVFLRQVEHQLQLEEGRQCHALPKNKSALNAFARAFGYQNGQAFMNVYQSRAEESRKILEKFLIDKGAGNLWVTELLHRHSDGHTGFEKLTQLGFKDPKKARLELQLLANGPDNASYPIQVRQRFAEIAPTLLEALSTYGNPDSLLLQLSEMLTSMKAPGTLYDLLKYNQTLCRYLVMLVSNSRYLCRILTRDPGLLDIVGTSDALEHQVSREQLEQDLHSLRNAYDPHAALYRLRDAETLRVATQDLVLGMPVAKVGDALSLLADVILESALNQAYESVAKRYGDTDIPLAILGLGKLGGTEMGYGSDMDLIFVYEGGQELENGMAPVEYFSAVASHTIRILKEPTRYGKLYDVDLRLRPDGGKGMLAISHERLENYFLEEARPWERLALMKVRGIAGESGFRGKVEASAKNIAFKRLPSPEELDDIEAIRKKLVYKATTQDLKRAEGGIGSIEFTVRYYQLQHSQCHPELLRGDVFGALDYMLELHLIDKHEGETLRQAYEVLRRIMNRLRMMEGNDVTEIPDSKTAQKALAERLEIQGDIIKVVQEHQIKVHEIYDHLVKEMYTRTS